MVFGPIDACDLWARRGSNRRAAGSYVGVLYCPRASNLALADRRGLLKPCLPDWWGLTVDECLDRSGPMGPCGLGVGLGRFSRSTEGGRCFRPSVVVAEYGSYIDGEEE